MKKVAFHNLGCKVNSYEMDAMLQELKAHGYHIVSFDEQADIYIVNTCTVTNMADRKSRQMLHKAKKMNPKAVVVAVGCYVQADAEGVRNDDAVDLIVGNNKKKDLVPILESFLQGIEEESVIDINHTNEYEEMQLTQTQEHTRAYIKIQDGCNQFCSYCLIPYARGRVRSRKKADIISEITGLIKAGYQEFVLTGIHISSYGVDFKDSDENLLSLMQEIDALEGMKRLRLGSFEPRIITQEFVDGLKQLKHLCPHFHLSLQSGCEATLKRMNRHYTPEEYLAGVKRLRAAFEHPAITTDVIVGFPGETEEEFKITYDFLKEVGFYEMHIFKYSKRNGTRAAVMENQVPEQVKTKRSNILLEMEAKDSALFREYYIGKEVEVLFEEEKEINGTSYWVGHTREYVKVATPSNGSSMENVITTGIITGVLEDEVFLFA
ncbi:MAG: tRNA (N(6)-L-threonylcarbamoyladenosine(37)-C(2))-methylthiotransferase MtaB [Lachnospiraceae bacterium]|nr:tRNA (N(6)-L-threonylcarbamoyladenosine(37)-C(2))-methylthiotransferase MtaB [Lachnospiraceae bacterium]